MVNMTLFQIQLLVAIRLDVNAAMHIVNLCGVIVQMEQLKLGTGGLTMAKYIDREALVEWLKRIPLKDLSDGLGLCRVIMEDDFKKAIKKMPKGIIVDAVPVSELKKLRDYLYAEDLIFMRGLAELNKLIANCGAKMDEVGE